MDKEILRKIKKCLAMADDDRCNTNQSQSAMLKAQKLMAEHGISQSQLMEVTSTCNVLDNTVTGYDNYQYWHGQLGKMISENFKCYCYVKSRDKGKRVVKSLSFVGLDDDLKIAKEVFYYAVMMIEYHSKVYIKNYKVDVSEKKDYKAIENSFVQGYLKGLYTKFEEQKEQNKQSWALVLQRDKKIDDYLDTLNLRNSKARIKTSTDQEHFIQGFTKGKEFEIIKGHIE